MLFKYVFKVEAVFLACLACSPSPTAQPAPKAAAQPGCAVDVWIVSWNIDYDGALHEDQVMIDATAHDHIEECAFADELRSWLDRATPAGIELPQPGSDWAGDVRLLARIVSSRGTDLLAIPFFCDWVRRNKKPLLKFDPGLLRLLFSRLSPPAREELRTAQRYGACAFGG